MAFKEELVLILIGALVFIVSFLWKDFISDMGKIIFKDGTNPLTRFFYIMIVTIIAISAIIYLRSYLGSQTCGTSTQDKLDHIIHP